jgi:hypothetical protein
MIKIDKPEEIYKKLRSAPDKLEFKIIENTEKITGKSFLELCQNINISPELGDPYLPESWLISYPFRFLPYDKQKILEEDALSIIILKVRVFAILIWLYSEESWDKKFSVHKAVASNYILKEQYSISYEKDQIRLEKLKNASKSGGSTKKLESAPKREKIKQLWIKHKNQGIPEHQRTNLICEQLNLPARTINYHIQKMNLREKKRQ